MEDVRSNNFIFLRNLFDFILVQPHYKVNFGLILQHLVGRCVLYAIKHEVELQPLINDRCVTNAFVSRYIRLKQHLPLTQIKRV